MAAIDLFNRVLRDLTDDERKSLAGLITTTRQDLLAARSEDASVRLAEDFARIVHDQMKVPRR